MIGTSVDVYLNLHKSQNGKRVYSIRSREKGDNYGRVVGHSSELTLANCVFVVGKKGRERVRERHCKNVHAVIRGTLVSLSAASPGTDDDYIGYCPYQSLAPTFYQINQPTFSAATEFSQATSAHTVVLSENAVYAKGVA
ncbi:hypothetical protein [uncultured Photobacterium sp.]|uniref:hypothetical protein n=1 Tax=uncultured Photobacterium sp. TaxID=173973 RepID=UPI00261F455E|nr:hypothetical protein [uncultured Photobacterium sp.]